MKKSNRADQYKQQGANKLMVTVIIVNEHQHRGVNKAHLVTLNVLETIPWEHAAADSPHVSV